MSQALTTQLESLIPQDIVPSKYASDEQYKALVKSGKFLPRIQLMGSSSDMCKKGKCKIGVYLVLTGSETIVADLTEQFSCLVLAWRPKALILDGADTKAFYNPESPTFKTIEVESAKKGQQGYVVGPEYLVYIPDHKLFATMLFSNPTMKRQAPNMSQQLGKAATLRVELIEKKFTWHGPTITGCSTPLNLPEAGTEDHAKLTLEMKDQITRFNTPPEEEKVEIAPEEAPAGGERAR